MTSLLFVTLDFSPSLIADGLNTWGLSAQMRLCFKEHYWDAIYDDVLSFLELCKWALCVAKEICFLSKGTKWMIQKLVVSTEQVSCRSCEADKEEISDNSGSGKRSNSHRAVPEMFQKHRLFYCCIGVLFCSVLSQEATCSAIRWIYLCCAWGEKKSLFQPLAFFVPFLNCGMFSFLSPACCLTKAIYSLFRSPESIGSSQQGVFFSWNSWKGDRWTTRHTWRRMALMSTRYFLSRLWTGHVSNVRPRLIGQEGQKRERVFVWRE